MRLDKVLYLCTVILNILIMVQGKKQLSSKPKFAEVVIGDNEAKEMRESDVDKKADTYAIMVIYSTSLSIKEFKYSR